jgi:hypothetical protein
LLIPEIKAPKGSVISLIIGQASIKRRVSVREMLANSCRSRCALVLMSTAFSRPRKKRMAHNIHPRKHVF